MLRGTYRESSDSSRDSGDYLPRTLADLAKKPIWAAREKGGKAPLTADGHNASNAEPATWTKRAAAARYSGEVGLMLGDFGNGLTLCGLDLDSCLDDEGLPTPEAFAVLREFHSYTEVSPSGRSLHVLFLVRDETHAWLAREMQKRNKEWQLPFKQPGQHREMKLARGHQFLTVTDKVLRGGALKDFDIKTLKIVSIPTDRLRVIGTKTLRWFIEEAGPAYAGKGGAKAGARRPRDGDRSARLLALAGKTQREGRSFEAFKEAAWADDDAAGHLNDQQHPERALQRAWKKSEAIGPDVAVLNENHAVVKLGSKTCIATFKADGEVEFSSVTDARAWFANRGDVFKRWFTSPHRQQFPDGLVFDPSGRAPETALNLWSGWAVKPNPSASCRLILRYIREVAANGNPEHADYILNWLAHMVQKPAEKPGVALVLKGLKGAGKDTLAVIAGAMMGRRYVAHVVRPDALVGRFNAPFATAILGHVEEAFWAGDPSKAGALQALITAETLPIERKGIDPVSVRSFVRLIMTTNEERAVPATWDERRYAVFEVSESRKDDRAYFDALYKNEIQKDGPASLMDYLMKVDLTGFDIRDVPQTAALHEQKRASLRGAGRWLSDLLETEDFPERANCADFYRQYEHFMHKGRRAQDPVGARQFGKEIKRMLPSVKRKRSWTGGKVGPWFYIFPPQDECRAEFDKWLKGKGER